MSEAIVIALLARAGSGKSTAAQYLIDKYGAQRISFAGPLKEMAKALLGFTDAQVYGDQKEVIDPRYGFSPRQFLQRLGNTAREIIGPTVWIDAAVNSVKNSMLLEGQRLFVIDDCRYVNEAQAISSGTKGLWKGLVVKMDSPDRASSADPNHPSEAEVDKVPPHLVDFVIENRIADGLAALHGKLDLELGDFCRAAKLG